MSDKINLSGLGLIEASAGTGKTYTIQNLFLRLVAGWENNTDGLPVESILVVTFTDAATAELKDRIRQILVLALEFFENPDLLKYGPENERSEEISADYKRIEELLFTARSQPNGQLSTERDKVIEIRLRKALLSFDNAMICTIHGFCQRMLQQHAFESGILFSTEFRNDDKTFEDLQSDFLRQWLYPEKRPLHLALLAIAGKRPPKKGRKRTVYMAIVDDYLCHTVSSRPDLKLTETGSTDAPEILTRLKAILEELRTEYRAGLTAGTPEQLEKLEQWQQAGGSIDTTEESVIRILIGLAAADKTDGESDYMKKIRKFVDCLSHFVRILPYYAAVQVKKRYEKAKQEENFQTYDDLLHRLNQALSGPRSEPILNAIREQFKAAFVDEFQDTDPIQYEIFKRLFGDTATGHILFFVGDPKQAIYGFRGGDIATYRKAKKFIEKNGRIYSLKQNFRSAPALLDAVNNFFTEWKPQDSQDETGVFADRDIPYVKVSAGKSGGGLQDAEGNADPEPMKFCLAAACKTKTDLKKRIMPLCVKQIKELLNSGLMIPGSKKEQPRPIRPGDIAVLVPTNDDAKNFRKELNLQKIPCIITKSENVFATDAAEYLETVLSAILSVTSKRLTADAMATPLLGFSPEEIRNRCLEAEGSENGTETGFDAVQKKLLHLNQVWERDGFPMCFQEMLAEFDVRTNLLSIPSGSRLLTDLMQLQELLHKAEEETRCSKEGLLLYLSSQIRQESGDEPSDLEATRMETDQPAVVLMTLHKSKGLEFPVVMLPFMFDKSWERDPPERVFYHDRNGDFRLSLTPAAEEIKQKELEDKQEAIRLLYVGLTRAVYSCYLFWGYIQKTAGQNSLSWLFPGIAAGGYSSQNDYPQLRNCAILPEENQPDAEQTNEKEDPEQESAVVPSNPVESIPLTLPEWKRCQLGRFLYTSFSTLSQNKVKIIADNDDPGEDGDGLDYDEKDENDPKPLTPEGIFKMPSGAAVGNAWHKILETIDFTGFDPVRDRDEVILQLQTFGILRPSLTEEKREEFIGLTLKMVEHVLNTLLDRQTDPQFRLKDIPMTDRLSELKFNYAFRHPVDMEKVRKALGQYAAKNFGADHIGIRKIVLDGGFLNGAVDLLFRKNGKLYIADWKSNRITGTVEGFDRDGLAGEMARHTYYFQYLIYTVAAMKYLGLHLRKEVSREDYEQYFGGVYYFFLRGIDRDVPGRGVFFDRPSYELIHELDQLIG